MNGKNITHLHAFSLFNESLLDRSKGFILGSVFCTQNRIDTSYDRWEKLIKTIQKEKKELYIQQPFYLYPDEKLFLDTLFRIRESGPIAGIFTNSPGCALHYAEHELNPIMSRFTIKKRKKTNRYLWNLLLEKNINTVECYAYDQELIQDIENLMLPVQIWKRFTNYAYNSFAPECLHELYHQHCSGNPGQCLSGQYRLENERKQIDNHISGHIIYNRQSVENKNSMVQKDDVSIYNIGRFEL